MLRGIFVALMVLFAPAPIQAGEPDPDKLISAVLAQIKYDSPVVARMMARVYANRRQVYAFNEVLPGDTLATTQPVGTSTIYIKIDVGKVIAKRQSLIATVIHEIIHADDIVTNVGVDNFTKMELEDRDLPWAERRLERRAIYETEIIVGYLALQFPDRYTPRGPQTQVHAPR